MKKYKRPASTRNKKRNSRRREGKRVKIMKLAESYPVFCPTCGERRVAEIDDKTPEMCLRCGFRWDALSNPATATGCKLIAMPDVELLFVFRLLYPTMSLVVSTVAQQTNYDTSYVLKVLQGKRKSVVIEKAIVAVFRSRLVEHNVGTYI